MGDQRVVTIKEGYAQDMHCLIVDDLVQSGGTLRQCKKALVAAGASAVSCYVTHAVFPQESWRRFIGAGFDRFYVTDTIPRVVSQLKTQPPFRVLSIVPRLIDIITGSKSDFDESDMQEEPPPDRADEFY
jgi:phosphoribosylpyrophosphate synthetase